MRFALASLALLAMVSCQSYPSATGSGGRDPVDAVSGVKVQKDVAAIIEGMEQARVDGLRRAGR